MVTRALSRRIVATEGLPRMGESAKQRRDVNVKRLACPKAKMAIVKNVLRMVASLCFLSIERSCRYSCEHILYPRDGANYFCESCRSEQPPCVPECRSKKRRRGSKRTSPGTSGQRIAYRCQGASHSCYGIALNDLEMVLSFISTQPR